MPTKPASLWQVLRSLTAKQKLVLTLLAAVFCTNVIFTIINVAAGQGWPAIIHLTY